MKSRCGTLFHSGLLVWPKQMLTAMSRMTMMPCSASTALETRPQQVCSIPQGGTNLGIVKSDMTEGEPRCGAKRRNAMHGLGQEFQPIML